ncbi:MAG: patatin family protein [Tissierellia bacterium]|nr:patatin family protein [Tissierellia bacterium]
MIGVIDVGGGMKAIYSAGLLDYCLDNKIYFDYALGVSAGSGNLMNYTSRQIGRAKSFYLDYSFRSEYLSMKNLFTKGEYCDLSYPYKILSNENGESPIDYETLFSSDTYFKGVVTNAQTGKAEYYGEETMSKNDYWISMASSAIPFVSKPYERYGKAFYDGGIADPIPLKQALADGCEKVVVIL